MAVIEVTKDNFNEEIFCYKGKALVDFWAEWCGPCMMLSPLIDKLDDEIEQGLHEDLEDIKLCKVNCDTDRDLALEYNINAIPCLIVFENGEEVDRMVGLVDKDTIKSLLR